VPGPSPRHTPPRQSPRGDRKSFLQQLESQFPVTVASHTESDLTGKTHSNLEESLIWIRQNARLSNERQQLLEQLEKEKTENERIQHELDELRQLHLATQRSWSRINEDLHSQLRLITRQKHTLVVEGCKDSKETLLSELDQLRQDIDQRDDLISQLFDRHVGLTDSETSTQDCEPSPEPSVTVSEDAQNQAKSLREERDAWKQVARNLEMRIVELSSRSGNDQ
jgi:chromosome segregation ATPase